MASPDINIWFAATVTFRELLGTDKKAITFTNKPPEEVTATNWWPLLISVSGLGVSVGQSGIPVQSSGSLTINDSWGSFGKNRRVSDLLSRYTLVDQVVTVQAAASQIGDEFPTDNWVTVWSGITSDVSSSRDTLNIGIEALQVSTKYVNKVILENTFSDAPSSSIGKAIPIVFGNATVPAISVTTETDNGTFVYAITRGDKFINSGVQTYYAKGIDGDYLHVTSHTNSTGLGTVSTGSNYPSPAGLSEHAVSISLTGSQFPVIAGGQWRFKGLNTTPSISGTITFRLYTSTFGGSEALPSTEPVAQAVVNKSDYASEVAGASDFWVKFKFAQPFVFGEGSRNLHLSMQLSNYTGSTTDFVHGGTSAGTGAYLTRLGTGQWQTVADYKPLGQIFPVSFTDSQETTVDEDGHGYGKILAEQESSSTYPSQTAPFLSELDLVVNVDGILDDSSGTITGTPSDPLIKPHHVIQMLSYEWNGSTWESDVLVWDFSEFLSANDSVFTSGANYYRELNGYSDGNLTLADIVEQLAREAQISIVQLTSGKFDVYPIGYTPSVAGVFTDENSILRGWRILDVSSVVNRLKLYYDSDLLNIQLESGLSSDSIGNYGGSLDLGIDSSSPYFVDLTTQSQYIYGSREAEELALNFISDSTSAENIAKLILSRFDNPHWVVSIEVPFWPNRSIELMDVYEYLSPRMPAYFGTSARAKLPTVEGEEVDLIQGHYWKQAKRYTCQVIGKDIAFDNEGFPSLNLDLRIIKPYHVNDPTVAR